MCGHCGYPNDVSDDEWPVVAPYPLLIKEDAKQRQYPLWEVFNGLRYIVNTGGQRRWMPHDLPPWPVVLQFARGRLAAGCFEAVIHELRENPRVAPGRPRKPTAVVFDSHTRQSVPESGAHARYDGAKRGRGSNGDLLALAGAPADAQDRAQVAALCEQVQAATGDYVMVAWVDQGYTGAQVAADAAAHGMDLRVVKMPDAKRSFVLLLGRQVVERSCAWESPFRRMVRDCERRLSAAVGLRYGAFDCFELRRDAPLLLEVHYRP